jgi:hypothetical protein
LRTTSSCALVRAGAAVQGGCRGSR